MGEVGCAHADTPTRVLHRWYEFSRGKKMKGGKPLKLNTAHDIQKLESFRTVSFCYLGLCAKWDFYFIC